MKKMKSVSKMTKKEKKAYYSQFRGSWGGISPVTRKSPKNKKKELIRREKEKYC